MENQEITIAQKGDIVTFERGSQILQGKVISILENSVVVDLLVMDNFESLSLEHSRTVVAHKNYTIISERKR